MEEYLNKIYGAVTYIKSVIGDFQPEVGIILGSGLGKLADEIENPTVIPYAEIKNFARSTAIGHKGNMIFGTLGGKKVCAMQGRFHYYEGYPMEKVTMPVRVMKLLGIKTLFVSNAAGGVNFDYKVGDLMIIEDHIGCFLPNPLIGPNLDDFGPRFPDMTRPYDKKLINLAEKIGAEFGLNLKKGTYLATTGPTYETPAEYRLYRQMGADATGMSTIPEVIVARQCGIDVFGMSVITNEAHDDYAEDYDNDGDDVIAAADAAADTMTKIFTRLISEL